MKDVKLCLENSLCSARIMINVSAKYKIPHINKDPQINKDPPPLSLLQTQTHKVMDKIMQVEQMHQRGNCTTTTTTGNQAYAMCNDDIELFTPPDVG
jgi:hypothetical protein